MEAVGAERIERGEIEALQDVEQHQRGQTLRVGRQFQHVETAIIRADRRDHLAAMTRKVLGGEEGPAGGNGCDDVVGDRPFVERARALRRDRASAGSLTTSPSAGAEPSNRKWRAAPASARSLPTSRAQSQAMRAATGNPRSA